MVVPGQVAHPSAARVTTPAAQPAAPVRVAPPVVVVADPAPVGVAHQVPREVAEELALLRLENAELRAEVERLRPRA